MFRATARELGESIASLPSESVEMTPLVTQSPCSGTRSSLPGNEAGDTARATEAPAKAIHTRPAMNTGAMGNRSAPLCVPILQFPQHLVEGEVAGLLSRRRRPAPSILGGAGRTTMASLHPMVTRDCGAGGNRCTTKFRARGIRPCWRAIESGLRMWVLAPHVSRGSMPLPLLDACGVDR